MFIKKNPAIIFFLMCQTYGNIDIFYVQDPKVELTEDELKFKADAIGIRGHNSYELDVQFYHPVDPDVRSIGYQCDEIPQII